MRILRHKRGNPDPEYAEAYPTAPPLDSTCTPLILEPGISIVEFASARKCTPDRR